MLSGLMLTAFLMGLGGIAHCAAMCGAPCAAAMPRGVPLMALVGRCIAYMLLGLAASTGAGLVSSWGQRISMLQPLWVMLQLAALILGVWLLWTGCIPRQINDWGQQAYHHAQEKLMGSHAPRWLRMSRPIVPLLAGLGWALMPCGLLYAALVVAALASEPWGGAVVMLCFALPSAIGVWAAPALLRRLSGLTHGSTTGSGAPSAVVPILWIKTADGSAQPPSCNAESKGQGTPVASPLVDPRWAVRLAGLSLTVMAAWAVWHQLVAQWKAWCA